ncbi:hypothetical protein AX769_04660 [Frondihabitans sp. PAMC 28766]|uniref:hypothetical protein n=1 Tax=Frondihabitans sp. PAMC 28766 TaxID=1795630 RepID=UPI00078E51BA|nr:hypothetical protein [Frondihabitans sp. PAMC 28766]AMM19560.1 hypothetical protein AX769_04660 [Frondihabitans sp. PAMC 28766]
MSSEPPPLPIRSAEFEAGGLNSRGLRHLAAKGTMARVVPGSYINGLTWKALDKRERYALRVREHMARVSPRLVASHWSAAALWGMPVIDSWPAETQVTDPSRSTSSRTPALLRRPGAVPDVELVRVDGILVTSAVRTAVDLALAEGFETGVVLFDHGLHAKMYTREQLERCLESRTRARRHRAATRALEFASGDAQYPGESFSRIGMAARGFPTPILQQTFFDAQGKLFADFWWPAHGIAGEFDGNWKYSDPRFLRGRTATQAVIDEKRRQNRLEAHPEVRRVVRWDYPVARDPDQLARRLLAGGLPRLDPRRRQPRNA